MNEAAPWYVKCEWCAGTKHRTNAESVRGLVSA